MSKHRVVKSDFWIDEYIETLGVEARYLFLYFLTCPETNILGIYKTTIRRICFETLIERNEVEIYLKRFSDDDKVHFIDGHILMVNFQKHQNPSGTMKVGINKLFHELPNTVKEFIFSKKSKIYNRLSKSIIDYDRVNINKDINKGKDNNINPVLDFDVFIEKMPESITEIWSIEQIKKKSEDLVDYCKSKGKRYKDYYAALRNFLKKDFPSGNQSGQYDFL